MKQQKMIIMNYLKIIMTNIMLKTKYMLLALIIALTLSCSPEDGEIGPQGLAGKDGKDGNANVTSVILEDVSLLAGTNKFSIPELTRDFVNNGLVLGYAGQASAWYTMPVIDHSDNSTIIDISLLTDGEIRIYSKVDISTDLRFVLIEGN